MKTKIFTLFIAIVACVDILSAWDYERVQIGDLYYNLDTQSQTAEVTSQNSSYPYWSTSITTVSIPESVAYESVTYDVISIGHSAFQGCRGLMSIKISNSVKNIGQSTFAYCTGLTFITIPNSVTSIGDQAFSHCSSLTSIEIPSGITSIGGAVFYDCSGLNSIEIPNSVTSIGSSAFEGCTGLTSITIPNSVNSIGSFAFFRCTDLISLTISNRVPNDIHWKISGWDYKSSGFDESYNNLQQIEAPAWFFDVPESDWPLCPKYLEHVTVNNGELNDNIYSVIKRSYKTLKSIDISGVSNTTLADEAFKDNYNLTELVLPACLTSISYMAVAGCVSLKQIDIPASVEEIDNRAFEDCRSLETLTFGGKQPASKPGLRMEAAESQLRKIGNWAFYNAHQLQHLEIPEGVEEIGDGAFYGCTYLQDLILPKSIKAIGDNCFALCSHLERIDIEALTPPTIFARTFFDVSRQIPVYVPEDVVAEYLNDEYWKEMNIQGAPTAIEEVSGQPSEVSSQKIMRNGQLLILSNGGTYNAQGARVEQ